MVDNRKGRFEMLILSTKIIMNYSVLTITSNLKEKNEKLKSTIRVAE